VTGPATRTVAAVLDEAAGLLDPVTAERARAITARAADPPAVAIAGRVSSGKSTLVNALVGRRVAPTDAGECTQVVSRFRFGRAERVLVRLRDGGQREVRFDADGAIPGRLGVPPEEVDHLQVELSVARLRAIELVDTPGVSSATAAGDRSERFLGFDTASREQVGRADAVVYLLTATGQADEVADLTAFGAGAGGRADAAIGVLGKADLIAGGDPAAAADLAGRLAARLAGRVRTVVPLWTLVAETVACGRLREPDAATAAAVADLDEATRSVLLADAGLFTDFEAPVDPARRRRLLELLAPAGAARAVAAVLGGARGAARLATALDGLSGRGALDAEIDRFAARADVLRAARMLNDAERLAGEDWDLGEPLRDAVELARAHRDVHVLDETEALDDLDAGRVALSGPDARAAAAVLRGTPPEGDVDAAIDHWREVEVLAGDPLVARLARTVGRSLALRGAAR
jgi:hypothetical protein